MPNMSYSGRALISFGKQKTMPMSVIVDLKTEHNPIKDNEELFVLSWRGNIVNVNFDAARMMMRHIGEIINITISKGKEGQARLDFVSCQYQENNATVRLTGVGKPPYSYLEK